MTRLLNNVRANCFWASLLRTQIHAPRHARARSLSNNMNNDRADGRCYRFGWIQQSWTFGDSYFSFRSHIIFTIISTHVAQKRTKNQCGKSKKKNQQDFCPRDIESCHLATARYVKPWSLNANLFFKEPRQLTKCSKQVHLNNIWQRTFHFKDLITLFLFLQTLWPYSLTKPQFFRFKGMSSPKLKR